MIGEELKPCPAGHNQTRAIGGPGTAGGPKYWAGCDHCSWRTWGDSEADAIAAWNLRAKPAGEVVEPFAWADELEWHKPTHRAVMATAKLGAWMSAALDDPKVCEAMKADISEWFSAGEPMETLGQALEYARTHPATTESDGLREAAINRLNIHARIVDYPGGEIGFKRDAALAQPTPDRDAIEAAALVSLDEARLALFNAIEAVKIGNPTDDKLILNNLKAAGYWLVRACAWCGGAPIRDVLDGEALCQPCCNKWARGEGFSALEAIERKIATYSASGIDECMDEIPALEQRAAAIRALGAAK